MIDLADLRAKAEAAKPAYENLQTCQRQLDMDGCMVGVSQQALDESLAALSPSTVLALIDMAEGRQWRPIESAPFEKGEDVLVAIPVPWGNGWYVTTAYYLTLDKCDEEADAGWWQLGTSPKQSFMPLRKTYGEPLRWQPLPPPPEAKEG